MSSKINAKTVAKNVSLSVLVQTISMVAGIVINLVVPKYIDNYQYAYWQTFLLYMQYVGFFHFGLIDGLVLRYSQYDYDEIDKDSVRSQFFIIMLIDVVVAISLIITSILFFEGIKKILALILALSIFSEICYNYILTLFQTTNRIQQYAKFVIFYRCAYCLLLIMCICFKCSQYYWLCLAYVAADFIGVFTIGLKYNKKFLFGRMLPFNVAFNDLKLTLSGGFKLMLASYSATLLVGFGKMVIQWNWDALTFGKVSLAYSMTTFILQFVTAISVVLFPSLKRMDSEQLPNLYIKIRNGITPILLICLLLYYPGSILLGIWLPAYKESMIYLGFLFPIILFTSKVGLLTNNYLNAYRQEGTLLTINIAVVVVSFLFYLIESFVFSDVTIVIGTMVIAIMVRSIVSEIAVSKCIHINLRKDIILDVVIAILFEVSVFMNKKIHGVIIYFIALIAYILIKRKDIKELFNIVLKKTNFIYKKCKEFKSSVTKLTNIFV